MTRARRSLFGPIAFAFCSLVFAAGAGYTWWLDHRARAPLPLREVKAATLPALEQAPPLAVASAPPRAAPSRERRARPAPRVRKCRGADGVPIFTSTDCPAGSMLEGEIAVDVPHTATPPPAPAPSPAMAVAHATVINQSGGYGIPDRQFRRDVERERAWDRCERGKLRAGSELAALRLKRKMSDIRRREDHVVRECADYEVLAR